MNLCVCPHRKLLFRVLLYQGLLVTSLPLNVSGPVLSCPYGFLQSEGPYILFKTAASIRQRT